MAQPYECDDTSFIDLARETDSGALLDDISLIHANGIDRESPWLAFQAKSAQR